MIIGTKFNIGDTIWTPYADGNRPGLEEVCDCCSGERKIYANNFGLITCPKCGGSGKLTSNKITYVPVSGKVIKITTTTGKNTNITYISTIREPYGTQASMSVSEGLAFATEEGCQVKCDEFNKADNTQTKFEARLMW